MSAPATPATDSDVDPIGFVDIRIRFGPSKHRLDFKARVRNATAFWMVVGLDLLLCAVALGLAVLLNVIYR